MRPGCVIQTPLINMQLLMSQRQSHLRASPILVPILVVPIFVSILVPILVDLRTSMAPPYTGHHAKPTRNCFLSHLSETPVNIDFPETPFAGVAACSDL